MRPSHFSQTNVALSMLGFLGLLYLLWYSPMPTISQHSDRYNNRRAHLSVLCKQSQKSFLFYPNSCDYFSAFSGGAGWRTAKQDMYHVYLGTNTKTKLLSTRTTTFVFKEKSVLSLSMSY